jgi:hypothetical protein
MSKRFVIPQVGVVRNPERGFEPLPPQGAEVTDSKYWRRRIEDGDVVLSEAPKKKSSQEKGEVEK